MFEMANSQQDCTVLDSQSPSERPAKLPRRERFHRPIVDSLVIDSLVASYNTHFATYSRWKKNVTQLVPGKVWKLVYEQFLREHPGNKFAEETLKDRLRQALKELKTGTSNEEGSEKAVVQAEDVVTRLRNTDSQATPNVLNFRDQSEDVLVRLRNTDSHAARNVLNLRYQSEDVLTRLSNTESHATCNVLNPRDQSSLGGNPPTSSSHPSSSGMGPSEVQDASTRPPPSGTRSYRSPNPPTISSHPSSPGMGPSLVQDATTQPLPSGTRRPRSLSPCSTQKIPTKAEILASQSKSMSSIARTMEARTAGKEALLSVKMDIMMEKRKSAKIANLMQARDLGVISEVEFKVQVRAVLGLGPEGAIPEGGLVST